MFSTRWFGHVDMGASYPSEPLVLEQLERVLDAARPTKVDRERSEAVDGLFLIAHAADRVADIYIEVNEDWAALDCMISQREIRGDRLKPEWISALARAVDQVLRAQYVIQRTYLRNEVIRTTVKTPGQTRRTATRWGRLPIPERFLTHEQIELDYGSDPS